MNARQGVIIAMFLSMAVYLLANANASIITERANKLKQTPKATTPTVPTVPTSPLSGGTSGKGTGGAGGGF